MIFPRIPAGRVYKDYHAYKPLLRRTFLNRCAYCLRHEAHFGGEANGQIDHLCPAAEFQRLDRPELGYAYANLFWSCGECNHFKRDAWPDAAESALGFRFVDSTEEDTDQHWEVLPTGEIKALTPAGRWTIGMVSLWRDDLVRWRREVLEAEQRINRLKDKIDHSLLTPEVKRELHEQMRREILFVSPHPLDRPPFSAKSLR